MSDTPVMELAHRLWLAAEQENTRLQALTEALEKLLVCYRCDLAPTEKLLDTIRRLRATVPHPGYDRVAEAFPVPPAAESAGEPE